MADTTFVSGTVVQPAWLNDVNDAVYGDPGVWAKAYGVTADGVTDDTAALQAAVDAAAGRPVYCPAGTIVLTDTIQDPLAPTQGFASPGIKIIGAGMHVTFFDHQAASKPLFVVDSDTHGGTFHAAMGARFEQFTIKTTTNPAGAVGIRVLNGYQIIMKQLAIIGLSSIGVHLQTGAYTDDGWNCVSMENMWIEACDEWGLSCGAFAGRNEGSFLWMKNVFFQSNGISSASTPPPSGGMQWKGQILTMESCAFANGNENVGLYIPGQTGLGVVVTINDTTFENCYKRSLYCTGVACFRGKNLQMYNNNTFIATTGVEFAAPTYLVAEVEIDGIQVRAGSGNNPYTAFKISGSNAQLDSCRIKNVYWDDYDYTGQTRFDGWLFDPVIQQCNFIVESAIAVTLKPHSIPLSGGNRTPLRLRGGSGGTPSTTGEWIGVKLGASGVGVNNSTLGIATTRYYAYLYDNTASDKAAYAPAIEFSETVPVVDATHGYQVKTGDATRLYIGSVITTGVLNVNGGYEFNIASAGWLNPTPIAYIQPGTFAWMWYSATGPGFRRTLGALPTSDADGALV